MDPKILHGPGFTDRVADFLAAYTDSTDERVPGDGRLTRRAQAEVEGIFLDPKLLETVRGFLTV